MSELLLEDVFAIDLIAKEILKYFPKQDLLNCALVNKNLNHLVREKLYDTEDLTLQLVLVENRESSSERLQWLQTSNQRIFKKLSLNIYCCYSEHDCQQKFSALLDQLDEFPIRGIGITSLEISDNSSHSERCEATEFLRRVCSHISDTIEILNTEYVKNFEFIFIQQPDQFIFPNLKSIATRPSHVDKLALMPSLEDFSEEVTSEHLHLFLDQEKSHIVKHLLLLQSPGPSEKSALERFAATEPKLKSLIIDDPALMTLKMHGKYADMGLIVKNILTTSCLSLKRLFSKVDHRVLGIIWDFCKVPLPNVSTLYVPQQQLFESEVLSTVPLSRLFPNLSTVIVTFIKRFSIDRNVLEDQQPNPVYGNCICPTVRTLIFQQFKYQYKFRAANVEDFSLVFPNVRNVRFEQVNTEADLIAICQSILSVNWPELEFISVGAILSHVFDCEWVFFGISCQEWKYWLELKKAGANLTHMQFAPLYNCFDNYKRPDFVIRTFKPPNPLPDSPTGLLKLNQLEPNLFSVATCIGSEEVQAANPTNLVHLPIANRLLNGIQSQLSKLWRFK